jgi:hypothetical protein
LSVGGCAEDGALVFLPDGGVQFQDLFKSHPDRCGAALFHRLAPEQENIHSLARYAVETLRLADASGCVLYPRHASATTFKLVEEPEKTLLRRSVV